MWWAKVIVLLFLAAAVFVLFRALTSMMKGEGAQGKTVKALAWRIGLSVAVFVFLILSMWMGWIQPHGVNPARQQLPSLSAMEGEVVDGEAAEEQLD